MTEQLIPLYILGGIFALYTAKQAFLWFMYEPRRDAPSRSLNYEARLDNNE
jgi:hypothetical protein